MGRGPVGEPAIIRYVNNSLASVDDVSGSDGSMILIKTLTASSSSTLSFVHGTSDVVLDSTYPIFLFKYLTKIGVVCLVCESYGRTLYSSLDLNGIRTLVII